jgi:hypothetical protein
VSRGYLALLVLVAAVAGGLGYFLSHPSVPPIAGIACEPMEAHGFHIHAHLELWNGGKEVPVPAGIGFAAGCFYWLHTHTPDGLVHVEAPQDRRFTLGQFFDIWGSRAPRFGPDAKLFVDTGNGRGYQLVTGDWRSLVLSDRALIALGTGEFTPRAFEFPAEL